MSNFYVDGGAIVTRVTSKLALRLTLEQAENSPSEWDGGSKQVFDWTILKEFSDGKSRVGCYAANRWYEVATGRTEKETLCNAKKHIRAILKRHRVPVKSFEYIKLESGW